MSRLEESSNDFNAGNVFWYESASQSPGVTVRLQVTARLHSNARLVRSEQSVQACDMPLVGFDGRHLLSIPV